MGASLERGKLLFELPVYRVSPDRWHREKGEVADRFRRMYEIDDDLPGIKWAVHGEVPFQYNQAIGWLRVIWDGPGPAIKAYAYRMRGRRFGQDFKPRPLDWLGKAFEIWFTRDDGSEAIAEDIRSAAWATVKRDGLFPHRWIDLEAFETLAPVIDFPTLLGLAPRSDAR